jgi:hypothetical protein
MLCVELSNGILVSAGWSREMDPTGHYLVSASSELEDVVPPIEVHDAQAALAEVVRLVETLRVAEPVSTASRSQAGTGAA